MVGLPELVVVGDENRKFEPYVPFLELIDPLGNIFRSRNDQIGIDALRSWWDGMWSRKEFMILRFSGIPLLPDNSVEAVEDKITRWQRASVLDWHFDLDIFSIAQFDGKLLILSKTLTAELRLKRFMRGL